MSAPTSVALIGFGEVGRTFGAAFRRRGVEDVRAFVRGSRDPRAARAIEDRLSAAGVRRCARLAEALSGATVVLVAVPVSAAPGIAAECAELIEPGALYVDVAPMDPRDKARAAHALSASGARYVDAALMGSVVTDGPGVPIMASGPGAVALTELAPSFGLQVSIIEGAAGRATLVKLLRSVYLKGRDALIAEMLLAARAHGVEEPLMESIRPPLEDLNFRRLAERTLCSLVMHAERRAEELEHAGYVLEEAGLDATLVRAAVARLRRLAALGLRERFGYRRPDDGKLALDAMVELSDVGSAPRECGQGREHRR